MKQSPSQKQAKKEAANLRHRAAGHEQEVLTKAELTGVEVLDVARNAAQVVLSKAELVAEQLKKVADGGPSNKRLQESIRKAEETINEHTKQDGVSFDNINRNFDQVHTRFDNLPTSEDVANAIRITVNGKIDKANATLGLMSRIFIFCAPTLAALFGWSIWWQITTSNEVANQGGQLSQVASVLQAIENKQ